MPNHSTSSMEQAVKTLYALLSRTAFKIFNTDYGKEFSCYFIIEKDLGLPVYISDSYSSW